MRAAITGKRVHYLEYLAHDPARTAENDRAFGLGLKQLGGRAISKAREVPARPAPPILHTLPSATTPVAPNRPGQPLPVPRAFAQAAAGNPALGSGVTAQPGQPGPARAADALLPVRPLTPIAAPPRGPGYPQTGAGSGTPRLQRPDPKPPANPVFKRSWLPRRLLDRLRLRR